LQRENALTQRESPRSDPRSLKGVISEASKPQPAPIDYPTATPNRLVADIAKLANARRIGPDAGRSKAMLAKQLPFHIQNGWPRSPGRTLAKR
jgi:hypothetical protein